MKHKPGDSGKLSLLKKTCSDFKESVNSSQV